MLWPPRARLRSVPPFHSSRLVVLVLCLQADVSVLLADFSLILTDEPFVLANEPLVQPDLAE